MRRKAGFSSLPLPAQALGRKLDSFTWNQWDWGPTVMESHPPPPTASSMPRSSQIHALAQLLEAQQ